MWEVAQLVWAAPRHWKSTTDDHGNGNGDEDGSSTSTTIVPGRRVKARLGQKRPEFSAMGAQLVLVAA